MLGIVKTVVVAKLNLNRSDRMGKERKKKTIGKMVNSRATWHIRPVTKIKNDATKYNRKKQKKNWRDYDEN